MNNGIEYFPFNVHLDDKFDLIEAEYGLKGFAVIVKLFQKIYGGQGYYCEWTEDIALLFARNIGLSGNAVSAILSAAIKRGIFNKTLYDKYSILTSEGIQKRYFEAVSRRKKVDVEKQYLLFDVGMKYGNVNILSKNVYINGENADNLKQSKVEESKGKESRVEESNSVATAVYDEALGKVINEYESNIAPITKLVRNNIIDWLKSVENDVIIYAIHEAVEHSVRNWSYINAILKNHFNAGRTTLQEVTQAGKYHKSNPNGLSVYTDETGFDYDSIEKIMQERYDND